MIILNSAEHAVALLDKRSTLYSDRPVLVMGGELVGWKYILALTPYGARFREYRRYIAKAIGGRAQMEKHIEVIESYTKKFLQRLLSDPGHVSTHIRKYVLLSLLSLSYTLIHSELCLPSDRTAGSIILKISHGYDIREDGDPIVQTVETALEQFSVATSPGAFLVDVFPLLRVVPGWFPGAGFQKTAQKWKHVVEQMVDLPYEFVKNSMVRVIRTQALAMNNQSFRDMTNTFLISPLSSYKMRSWILIQSSTSNGRQHHFTQV
jgi:hypothetical protein